MDYSRLDPQQVLASLEAVSLHGDGRVLQLNSYENRVFQVFLDDGRAVVAKFYRPCRWSDPQIVEEHQFALELAAAEVPVVPPLALRPAAGAVGLELLGEPSTLARHRTAHGTHRFAVAMRCTGREPELEAPSTLSQLGRFIGRLHAVGRRSSFRHRHQLDPSADGQRALALLRSSSLVTEGERPAWQDVAERAVACLVGAFESFSPLATLRLHGDCHLGNVLWRFHGDAPGPHVVDLDDAMMGPAVQDLWMLVSGDHATMAAQLDRLLEGYEQFCEFDDRQRRLIEPLRTLRMLRYSAWLAERWDDPSFPLNFPHFATQAYWSQQTVQLREQLELMAA